jgi:hypothetical protein
MPLVRWVGQPDPVEVNREKVEADIAAGKYTREDVWAHNARREIVLPGISIRFLGPTEGLSKHYQWGPHPDSYVIAVTHQDWKRIQALPEAKRFALVNER